MPFFWGVTLLAALAAGFELFTTLAFAASAPQQAAGAALAVAIVAVPYVFSRAVEGIFFDTWRSDVLAELRAARSDHKAGVDSLWKQLDQVRQNSLPAPSAQT